MARIRSIHPGILTDEAFMTLTVECPLAVALMLGLWMEADDAGTFEWKPISLKARCLPAVTTPMQELLEVLSECKMIKKFEVDGRDYGVIRNFGKYQRPRDPKFIHPQNEEMLSYSAISLHENARQNATFPRDQTAAERKRRQRERDKGGECHGSTVINTDVTRDNRDRDRDVNGDSATVSRQMEDVGCRRKDEEESISSLRSDSADAPQPNLDLNSEIQIKPEPIAKPKTTKPPKPVKTAVDPNASPTADDRTYAANLGMNEATLANEWEKFKLNHLSRQTRAVSWAMTWQTWVRNWVSYGARNIGDKPWSTASPKPSFTEIKPAGLEAVPVHETEEEANRWWHNRMMGTTQ